MVRITPNHYTIIKSPSLSYTTKNPLIPRKYISTKEVSGVLIGLIKASHQKDGKRVNIIRLIRVIGGGTDFSVYIRLGSFISGPDAALLCIC